MSQTTSSSCPSGGSSLHMNGFHQVDMFGGNRELPLSEHRMGLSTVPSIDCSKTSNHTTDVCKNKVAGPSLYLDAHWDRHVVTKCGTK